jgi:hypothetical protein
MNQIALPDRKPVVFVKDGAVFASSRDVAEFFEKRHDHVLRDIDNLISSAPEAAPNFGETVSGRQNPSGGASLDGVDHDLFLMRSHVQPSISGLSRQTAMPSQSGQKWRPGQTACCQGNKITPVLSAPLRTLFCSSVSGISHSIFRFPESAP